MPVFKPRPSTSDSFRSVAGCRLALVALIAALTGCAALPAVEDEEADAVHAEQAVRPSVVCSDKQGNPFALRKKVLVLALPVKQVREANDLPNLDIAWSTALQQRLLSSDRFLVRDGSRYVINPVDDVRKQVANLARMFDAQIVIAGQITSLGVRPGSLGLGAVGAIPLPFGDVRAIETVLDIYDGQSGARLARIDNQDEARGKVINQGGGPLLGDFFRTPLGEATARMLNQQVEAIKDELACLPLQAHIVRTQDGEARVDAGFTSHLKPGDVFRVIQHQGFPSADGGQIEKSFGNLVIKQVFPEAAIGQFQGSEQPDWRYSVMVRAW